MIDEFAKEYLHGDLRDVRERRCSGSSTGSPSTTFAAR